MTSNFKVAYACDDSTNVSVKYSLYFSTVLWVAHDIKKKEEQDNKLFYYSLELMYVMVWVVIAQFICEELLMVDSPHRVKRKSCIW